jgi:[NiFe] hydrogenase diaphorase moiety small subunit
VIDSPTGKLGDSTFAASDRAAHVCPVGAILAKRSAYTVPIGQRLYDRAPISQVGDVAANEGRRAP